MTESPAIVWLRDDLRLDDQPALAAIEGREAHIVYIHDEESPGLRPLGGASKWWLAQSLRALGASIAAIGGRLDILRGDATTLLTALTRASGATHAYWTRRYGGSEIAIDAAIKKVLKERGVEARSFNGCLLREPWEIVSGSGEPFRIFTPFWKRLRAMGPFPRPLPAPKALVPAPWPTSGPTRVTIADLALEPTKPDWSAGLRATWRPGETGAKERLQAFIDGALRDYADQRDRPDQAFPSRLAPHLRFGEISARRVAASVEDALAAGAPTLSCEKYLSELGWREFSYNLLYAFPDLAKRNWRPAFNALAEQCDEVSFAAWSRGDTGYPIVDAGMRELWRTGYMHNRVRMIAASFLVKHLLCDWRQGESWFWDTLCDADPANNPANWQWIAGSGADAAPYFRIFNPVLQGEKFDPHGDYVRRWAPELSSLDATTIHAPWRASAKALRDANVVLGETYPHPIVDHQWARNRALAAFAAVKAKGP